MSKPVLAHDRRTIDQDGRLRVPDCNISKANVCGYYGREIPGYERLGLDADAKYQLYRDPEELRKAAESFETIPLLMDHVPVTAESHEPDLVVGTVSNIRYEHPYLKGDVTVWTQDAIDAIKDSEQKELSCAYRYVADLGVGTSPEGLRYDITMRNLLGNHVALVKRGRAGPDVVVADSVAGMNKMRFTKTIAALATVLGSTFTPAAQLALDGALNEELEAMDNEKELDEAERKAACDAMAIEKNCAADALADEDKREAYRRAAADKRAKDAKPAQDAAPVVAVEQPKITDTPEFKAALEAATASAVDNVKAEALLAQDAAVVTARDAARLEGVALGIKQTHALYAARETVAARVGVIALDSADAPKDVEGVYRTALGILKVDHAAVSADALPALYSGIAKASPALASDAALDDAPADVNAMIPALQLIRRG
jgi:hypothetical protein